MKLIDTEYLVHSKIFYIAGDPFCVRLWLSPDYSTGNYEGDDADTDPDLYQITLRPVVPYGGGWTAGRAAKLKTEGAVAVGLTYGSIQQAGGLEALIEEFKGKVDQYVLEQEGRPVDDLDGLIAGLQNEDLKKALRFVKEF